MIVVQLPEELEKRLRKLTKKTKRPQSWHIREALIQYLETLEDIHHAETRYEKIASGKRKTIPIEKVEQRLGLEG